MSLRALLLAAMMMICPGALMAKPGKCIAANGAVTYTDLPCADAAPPSEVSIVDNSSDSAESRRAAKADKAARAAPPAAPLALAAAPSSTDTSALARTCPARKRDYEIAASSIKPDAGLIAQRHAAAVRACAADMEGLPAKLKPARGERRATSAHGHKDVESDAFSALSREPSR